jgi:teichuronic acid biosynthesis glycosyltransferase TuaH
VPSYLAAADVGITPYTASAFNRASFPLKTLEYLGAGLPVVSTDLPGARWLLDDLARTDPAADQIMTLAAAPAEVVAEVRRMAGEPGREPDREQREPDREQRADRCRAFAARHSWARRAATLAGVIGFTPSGEDHEAPIAAAGGR